jgi:hypothetical protein
MLYNMAVPNSMWSCVVNIVVYLHNRTYNRSVGLTRGIPLTLLTSWALDASKFRVFGCAVFAKVPDKLRRKLGDKAFRGVMVGYPTDAPWYYVYNLESTDRDGTDDNMCEGGFSSAFPPWLRHDRSRT